MASQMAYAKLNIQSINIDTLNSNKSILDNSIWVSTYQSIIFDL